MKKIAVAAAVAGALCGCSVTREVEVYEPVRLAENQKVCVVRNEKLEKRGYLDIVMDSAGRHGFSPIAVESMKTKRCPFYLTYAVKYKRDFKEFISSAKLNLYKGKKHVSSGKYVLDGSYMNLSWGKKYETAEAVMDMMFEDLLAKLAETAPQDYYDETEKSTAEQPVADTQEAASSDQPAAGDETNLNPEEATATETQSGADGAYGKAPVPETATEPTPAGGTQSSTDLLPEDRVDAPMATEDKVQPQQQTPVTEETSKTETSPQADDNAKPVEDGKPQAPVTEETPKAKTTPQMDDSAKLVDDGKTQIPMREEVPKAETTPQSDDSAKPANENPSPADAPEKSDM